MKKLGLICSFIIFAQALFALSVDSVNPAVFGCGTTSATFTFDCAFSGTVQITPPAGVAVDGLTPGAIPGTWFGTVTNGELDFDIIIDSSSPTPFTFTFLVIAETTMPPTGCASGSTSESITHTCFPLSNDNCAGAINLPVSTDMCTALVFPTANATASSNPAVCGITGYYDLFYKFTANNSNVTMEIPVLPGTFGHLAMYDACGGNQLICKTMVFSSQEQLTGLIIGNEYFLQIIFNPGTGTLPDQELCLWSETASTPVTWLKPLSAKLVDRKSHITFSTAQQTNNSHFEIEHSEDGRDYLSIGKIDGEGDISTETEYEYIHDSPNDGLNYYRIKQVDHDGQFSYGNVASMVCNKGEIRAYPNPVEDMLTVSSSNEGSLTIFSNVWQEVGTYQLIEGRTEVDMSQLGTGIYFLKYSDGTVERIVKN